MGLSGLNAHRKKYHFISDNKCPCCNMKNENEIHFFLTCPSHAAHRGEMLAQLLHAMPQHADILNNTANKRSQKMLCNILINGTDNYEVDLSVFKIISSFIEKTNIFKMVT